MKVENSIEIEAPMDQVWDKISRLTDIALWTRTVRAAHFHTETERGVGAGRTCDVPGFGTLVENVLEWKEGESYTLSLEGLPFFVKKAHGGWSLKEVSDNRTRATTFIVMKTGLWPVGALMEKFVLGPQLNKTIAIVQSEFKAFVERGDAADQVAQPPDPVG
ncbi:MAG: putative membrane protein [Rhodothermales bacterium]|jgi:uncharacterized membrane protein